MLHQRTFFPYVVGALSLALAGFIAFAVTHRSAPASVSSSAPSEQVSDSSYRTQMKGILLAFDAAYPKAKNDIARLVLVEDTLSKVLSVRVPENEKAFHLEIAVSLNAWRDGLRGEASALAAARTRYAAAEASADWLKD